MYEVWAEHICIDLYILYTVQVISYFNSHLKLSFFFSFFSLNRACLLANSRQAHNRWRSMTTTLMIRGEIGSVMKQFRFNYTNSSSNTRDPFWFAYSCQSCDQTDSVTVGNYWPRFLLAFRTLLNFPRATTYTELWWRIELLVCM